MSRKKDAEMSRKKDAERNSFYESEALTKKW